ncbi:MAG TPA: YtxH domain-containing protein [Ktedonobacteraceae bacterium]
MNNFTKGILVGVGVGLLVAPFSGEETRRRLASRVQELRNSLPEDSRLNYYADQLSQRVTDTKENLRDYAQQAVSTAKDTGASLSTKAVQTSQDVADRVKQTSQDMANKAKQTSQDVADRVKQTSQDMADKAKQTSQDAANKTRQSVGYTGSGPNGATTRAFPENDPNA